MIGRIVTSIVTWISCKIIFSNTTEQAPFRQFYRTHPIFLSIILMVNMLTLLNLKYRACLYSNICHHFSLFKNSRVKTFNYPL